MGIVYAAWHVVLDCPVAIKFLRDEFNGNASMVERFTREARACAPLSSPHVIKVLDVGVDDSGRPYTVMEHLQGSDLGQLLEEQERFPVAMAIDFVIQACDAVAEAHEHGIVHRDLKPENLFLASDGENELIKVLDFGVSKRAGLHTLTRDGEHLGSPHYMAPEQVTAAAEVDQRADIWSLGVVLFELVSGQPVFDGATIPEILSSTLRRDAPPLRSVQSDAPALLERVLEKCLEKSPADRFQSVRELRAALELVRDLEA